MSDTLRDQLLGLGFKPAPKADKPPRPGPPRGAGGARPSRQSQGRAAKGQAPAGKKTPTGEARSRVDIDLAKAYAIRAQREKQERIAAEQRKQEEARQRREARSKLAELLEGKALNAPEAGIARHFEYGGKIRRIHVTADQLAALNAGELGVVQLNGRYLLVTAAVVAVAETLFAPAVALKVDPDAPAADDPYADPQYQVPDDLVW
jgi:uncharacterized protein YaiL (DUF2058 family)